VREPGAKLPKEEEAVVKVETDLVVSEIVEEGLRVFVLVLIRMHTRVHIRAPWRSDENCNVQD
jgi:hypothetical protein